MRQTKLMNTQPTRYWKVNYKNLNPPLAMLNVHTLIPSAWGIFGSTRSKIKFPISYLQTISFYFFNDIFWKLIFKIFCFQSVAALRHLKLLNGHIYTPIKKTQYCQWINFFVLYETLISWCLQIHIWNLSFGGRTAQVSSC
jgi:hypothetical protein